MLVSRWLDDEVVASNRIEMKDASGKKTVAAQQVARLKISFRGHPPWRYTACGLLGAGTLGQRLRQLRVEAAAHSFGRRLLGGILTQGVKALHDGYALVSTTVPAKQAKGRIFISKAVILLCAAKKNRDADHLQNFVYDQMAGIDAEILAADLLAAGREPIPDYAFDCHTLKGKRQGKTKADFFREEQRALDPFQPGLFDDLAGS